MSAELEACLLRLRDDDAEIRRSAAAAVGRQREIGAVPALLSALKDRDFMVRAAAARALGDIGDISTLPTLLKILKSGNPHVCQEVAYAVNKMGVGQSLPHKILADQRLSPEQRAHTLNELRNVDRGNFYVTLSYSIPDLRHFCRQASTSKEPDVVEGARIVLEFLENSQTLLRASQRNDISASQELLRAAGPDSSSQPDMLLRASTINTDNE